MCRLGTIGVIATLAALTAGSGAMFAQEAAKPAEPAAQEAAKPAEAAAPAAQEAAKPVEAAKVVSNAKPVDKVIIAFNKKAKDNGEVKFTFTPTGGAAMEIRVTIAKDMNDEDSARAALKEFKVALGDEKYSLDLDDGTKVVIKGKKDAKFNVAISAMSVPGLTVEFK
jgi:hypothetical protein